MDDTPARAGAPEDECEATVGRVRLARELPAPRSHYVVLAERLDFEFGEGERAHLRARVVARLVAFENRLPAAHDVVAGDEGGRVLLRVALHIPFDDAPVPRHHLRL